MFLMIKVSIVLLSELFFSRFPCFYQLLALLNNSNKCFFYIITILVSFGVIGLMHNFSLLRDVDLTLQMSPEEKITRKTLFYYHEIGNSTLAQTGF